MRSGASAAVRWPGLVSAELSWEYLDPERELRARRLRQVRARWWGPRGRLEEQAENKGSLLRFSTAAQGASLQFPSLERRLLGPGCAVRRPQTSGRALAQSRQPGEQAGVKSWIYAAYIVSLRTEL